MQRIARSVRQFYPLGLVILFVGMIALPARPQIRDGGVDPSNLGKGDWVYSITDATNKLSGHVTSVTNENSLMLYYKTVGIRFMVVKAGTGDQFFNGCYGFPQLTTYLVNVAHSNGILIFGYNRSYATNTAGESAIADFVFNQGCDGFIWDAEAEWESTAVGSQGPTLAWNQCSMVRSNWPSKFLAHSPFAIIGVHNTFPFKEFGYWCDAVMPQIYHFSTPGLKRSPSAAINWSDVNWKSYQSSWAVLPPSVINGVTAYWTNAIKPIAPIQDVYGTGSSVICEGTASAFPDKDVLEFLDYLAGDPNTPTAGGYKGALFYRTDLHDAVQFANIKSGTPGNFAGQVNNIVLDNIKATLVGGPWSAVPTFTATTTSPTFIGNGSGTDTNSFGTNYICKVQGTGTAYAQFTPTVVVAGDYNVYQWHPTMTNASATVPFVITYNGGTATVIASQQTNDGNWSLVGKFSFASGTNGNIRITDAIAEPTGFVTVDGLKLVFVPPVSVPAAPNGLSATAVSGSQINLAWTDHSTNEAAYILARSTAVGGPFTDIAALAPNSTNYANTNLTANTTYFYSVRATNWLGSSATSSIASATTPIAPAITNQPQSQSVTAGSNATFSVGASGTAPLAYQWRFYGTNISGATTNPFTVFSAQAANAGPYSVVVSNIAGTATSADAALTVVPAAPPHIDSIALLPDGRFELQVSGGPAHYSIQFASNLVDWAELSNFTTTNSPFLYIDPATNLVTRFYRISRVP